MIDAVAAAAPLDPASGSRCSGRATACRFYLEELAGRRSRRSTGRSVPITLTGQLQARLAAPGIDRDVVGVLAVAGQEVD